MWISRAWFRVSENFGCMGAYWVLRRYNTPIMENQMEKKMRNEVETGEI